MGHYHKAVPSGNTWSVDRPMPVLMRSSRVENVSASKNAAKEASDQYDACAVIMSGQRGKKG